MAAVDERDRQQLWQQQQTYMHSTRAAYIPTTIFAAPVTMDRLEEYIVRRWEPIAAAVGGSAKQSRRLQPHRPP